VSVVDRKFLAPCGLRTAAMKPLPQMTSAANRVAYTACRRSAAGNVALALLLFFLLANIQFLGMERFTTGRVAIVLMILWAFAEGKNPFRLLASRVWLPFLPILYVAMQFLLIGDSEQLSRFVNLAIYSYLGSALFVTLAGDVKTVLWTLLSAIALQSAIILFSFFSLDYRAWFDTIIFTSSNYDASYRYRAPGFTSGGGASLSLTQSLGVLIAWLLLRPHQTESVKGRMTYVVVFAALLITASCIVVGRTGLLLSGLFLGLMMIESRARWQLVTLSLGLGVWAWLYAAALITSTLGDNFSLEFFTKWAFASFLGEGSSVRDLSSMPIPPISLDTLIGTGLGGLVDGGNPSGHDAGFVQTYFSMGLFFAIVFYSAYLYVLLHCFRWLPRRWRFLLPLIFFMLELKEPFVFKYSLPFVVLALHFAHRRLQVPSRTQIGPRVCLT